MDLENIGKIASELIDFVSTLPQEFQIPTYEILLKLMLQEVGYIVESEPISGKGSIPSDFTIPIDVRAFLTKYEIGLERISKVFLIADNEIAPIYKITTPQKSKAQIQVSCLSAFQSALNGGKFEFSMKSVKKHLKDLKAFDSGNFKANYRNNSKMFKDLKDEEHVELSEDGKEELARTIRSLTKE